MGACLQQEMEKPFASTGKWHLHAACEKATVRGCHGSMLMQRG